MHEDLRTAIDNLFPLKAGKSTSFEGTRTISRSDQSLIADLWIHMEIIKESSIVIS